MTTLLLRVKKGIEEKGDDFSSSVHVCGLRQAKAFNGTGLGELA